MRILGVILLLLYISFGCKLFHLALDDIGGRDAYIKEIGDGVSPNVALITYYLVAIAVIFAWPIFIISNCFRR